MIPSAVRAAEAEARRFLKRVDALKKTNSAFLAGSSSSYVCSSVESAAVKRASMDLTRALSDMRQGREGAKL